MSYYGPPGQQYQQYPPAEQPPQQQPPGYGPPYGPPVPKAAAPQPLLMGMILAIVGGALLIASLGLFFLGIVFGVIVLICGILAFVLRIKPLGIVTWVMGLMGMIVSIVFLVMGLWTWLSVSPVVQAGYDACMQGVQAGFYSQSYCDSLYGVAAIPIWTIIFAILGMVGGVIGMMGGFKIVGALRGVPPVIAVPPYGQPPTQQYPPGQYPPQQPPQQPPTYGPPPAP